MKRTNGTLAWKIFIGVVAALLIALFIAEFAVRAYLAHRVESEFDAASPTPVSAESEGGAQVSFGSSPVSFGLLTGKVPHATLSVPSTLLLDGDSFTGQPAATVEVDNLHFADAAGPLAESLSLTTKLPDAYVQAILEQQLRAAVEEATGSGASFLDNLINVSEVRSSPADGTVSIEFTNGLAALELKPMMEGEQLIFEADSTSLLGIELPGQVASTVSSALREGMQDVVVGDLRVRNFTVIDGGLLVGLAGHDVNLSELAQAE